MSNLVGFSKCSADRLAEKLGDVKSSLSSKSLPNLVGATWLVQTVFGATNVSWT